MMTEDEIKKQIEAIEKQRIELLANLNALEGALQAFRIVLNPPAKPQQE